MLFYSGGVLRNYGEREEEQSQYKQQEGLVRLRVPGKLYGRHCPLRNRNQVDPCGQGFHVRCVLLFRQRAVVRARNQHAWGSWGQHAPLRDRKLLLQKRELRHLNQKVKEKGLTIVAVRLFISENGYAKLNIALARGKKQYDKRESIKEKDLRRAMERGE